MTTISEVKAGAMARPAGTASHALNSHSPQECRPGCGACCTAPSISSPIPGMPHGKPAGVRCIQLDDEARCRIFGQPGRPAVCGGLQPCAEMCGPNKEQAMFYLTQLERLTQPQ